MKNVPQIPLLDIHHICSFTRRFPKVYHLLLAIALLPLCRIALSQSYLTSTGAPSFAAPEPVELGDVDTSNGNLHLGITLGTYPQRAGQPEPITLEYDSSFWTIAVIGNTSYWYPYPYPGTGTLGGWYLSSNTMAGGVPQGAYQNCTEDDYWRDQNGTVHAFHLNTDTVYTTGCPTQGDGFATDSSGYHMYVWTNQTPNEKVYAPDGTLVYTSPITRDPNGNYVHSEDSNGNYLSSASSTGYNLIDTLGRQVAVGSLLTGTYPISVLTSQGTAQYSITTADINVKTNFQQSGVVEDVTSLEVIRSITLPDAAHSTYYFTYDCDSSTNSACASPSGQSAYYGTLIGITLPTGGTVTYSYTTFSDAYSNKARWVTSRVGAGGGTWYYSPQVLTTCSPTQVNCQQKTTVTAPNGSTTYTFQLNNGAWPVSVVRKDLEGHTLTTVTNTWDFSQSCVLIGCHGASFIRLSTQQTAVYAPGGTLTKQVSYSYDSPQFGNQTAVKEWRYISSGSFGSVPDRATYMTYLNTGTNNINRPLSITLCNNSGSDSACPGGGSRVSQKLYSYDSYGSNGLTLISGVAQHDDSNFGLGYTQRGNVTSESDWVSGSNYLTTTYTYDTTGQVLSEKDPAGNVTQYYYTDAFYTDLGNDTSPSTFSPTSPTDAYLTKVIDAIGTQTVGYYWGAGKVAKVTDYNGAVTTNHYQDNLDRQTEQIDPSGWKLAAYTSVTQSDMYSGVGDISPSVACSSCQHTQTILDSWGRTSSNVLVNAPIGPVNVDNTYDGSGQVEGQTHPYAGLSDPNHVSETFGYDGVGRQVSIIHPDGQMQQSAFGSNVGFLGGLSSQLGSAATFGVGYPQIAEDERGLQKQQWVDGFGRVIEVDETSASSATFASKVVAVIQSGSEWMYEDPCQPHSSCPQYIPNSGLINLTIGGYVASTSYSPNGSYPSYETASQVASALASDLNNDPNSPVSASVSGANITLTAKGPGSPGNVSFSSSETYNSSNGFTGPAFSISPSTGSLTGGSGGINSSPYYTNYIYDAANNLTQVVQGVQTRTFNYDGLGRKISETTPETGTITYSYALSGGGLCSGDPSKVCQRTDARGVVSAYTYDHANRLTGVAYTIPGGKNIASMPNVCTTAPNGSSANVCYFYDQGGAAANALGRLTETVDPTGSETNTYDIDGRVTHVSKVINGQTFGIGYAFDAGGDVTQITYPSGRVVYQAYNAIGQLCQISSSAGGCGGSGYYASIPVSSSPATNGYDAPGHLVNLTYGNGVTESLSFSAPRMQLSSMQYAKGSQTYFSLGYWYQQNSPNCPNGVTQNDGSVQCITDNVDSGRSISYGYDTLGRLISAKTNGSTSYPQWGLSQTYDRFGNRLSQSVTAGSGPSSSLTFGLNGVNSTTTNQPNGYTFDASGNMTVEPLSPQNNMTYDGENRMTGFSGNGGAASYTYDGGGLRVIKSGSGTTTVTVYSGSSVIAEYDNGAAPTSPSREYIYNSAGGDTTGLLAMISGGATTYYHQDHLSVRFTTDSSGSVLTQEGDFPFGEQWYLSGSGNKWFFTSYQRDPESGLDYALARYYDSRTGTFCSADPLAGDPSDPQSWNRYPYGRNDPIDMTDPSGKSWWSSLLIDVGVGVAAAFLPEAVAAIFPAADDVDAAQAALTSGNVAASSFTPQLLTRGATAAISGGIGDAAAAGTSFSLGVALTGAGAAQASQDADKIPNKLIPKKYQATFNAAYTDALQRLKKPDCANLYGGQGAKIMASTQYEVVPMDDPDVGADTKVPGAGGIVRLNSNGPMYDYSATSKYFKYWKFGFSGGSQVGSVFLLHELGHQLGDITHFFNPDAGAKNAARNAANTDRVLKNCF